MLRTPRPRLTASFALIILSAFGAAPQPAVVPDPWPYPDKLAMVQRNVLVRVDGRLDHMALDPVSNHLYVAAFRNNSVEVLHAPTSRTAQSIADLSEPSGILFVPETRKVVVACSGAGEVRVFSAAADGTLTPDRTVSFENTPDTLAYDARSQRVYVGHAESLGSFLLATGEKGPSVPLPGRPEAIIVESRGERIFVNIPSIQSVAVVDRVKNEVVAKWALSFSEGHAPAEGPKSGGGTILNIAEANFPLAIDETSKRLFVPLRYPAILLVLDTDTGRRVASVDRIAKDADDCWYDDVTGRIFITGGGGSGEVTAVRQNSPTEYAVEMRIKTASAARTSYLSVEQRKLYVGVPSLGDDQAYVFVYLIGPK